MNQKQRNREESKQLLISAGITCWKSFNNDVHWKKGRVYEIPERGVKKIV